MNPSSRPLPEGWRIVRFGDVVRNAKVKVDPETSGLERYVAGGHMETDNLHIRNWGTIGDGYLGPAFHRKFVKGQVLYGSRRTYLRKVAVAEFAGVCANTTFVLEPKGNDLLPELLPFIMQTEAFTEHSIKQSKGSTNPYVNWKDLAWYEFPLPPLDEQRRIADILWAADRAMMRFEDAEEKLRCANQCMIDELFRRGLPKQARRFRRTSLGALPAEWKVVALQEVTKKIVDGVHKRPMYTDSGVPFITVENLTRGQGIDFSDTRFISVEDHREFKKRANPEIGDVLVSKDGTLGVARLVETAREFSIFVSVALLKPDRECLDGRYLRSFFSTSLFRNRMSGKTSGSALKHIHLVDFRSSLIPLPSLPEQEEIAGVIEELDSRLVDVIEHRRCTSAVRRGLIDKLVPTLPATVG